LREALIWSVLRGVLMNSRRLAFGTKFEERSETSRYLGIISPNERKKGINSSPSFEWRVSPTFTADLASTIIRAPRKDSANYFAEREKGGKKNKK